MNLCCKCLEADMIYIIYLCHEWFQNHGFAKVRNLPGTLSQNSSESSLMTALAIGDFTWLMGQRDSIGSVFPSQLYA